MDPIIKHNLLRDIVQPAPEEESKLAEGVKYDGQKPRYDLVPPKALAEIVKVLTMGALKYDDDNWKKVPQLRRRYYAALLRHMEAWREGEALDPETGLHHLAHAGCCLFFLLGAEVGDADQEYTPERAEELLKSSRAVVGRLQKRIRELEIEAGIF